MRYVVVLVVLAIRQLFSFSGLFRHVFELEHVKYIHEMGLTVYMLFLSKLVNICSKWSYFTKFFHTNCILPYNGSF